MSGRPAIPVNIIRKIMIEAGHRCAACGTPCPLEKAHIIPWSESNNHSAENLICLCANCHERADNEPWDQKTLQEYKKNPWVNRQFGNSPPETGQRRKEVQVTIDLSRAGFDETEELWIRHGVASFLDIPPQQVRIVSIKEGSVKVTLSLPEDAASRLLDFVRSDWPRIEQTLAPLPIRSVEAVEDNVESSPVDIPIDRGLGNIQMAALARGDQSAWEQLYRLTWPVLLRFLESRGTELLDAEDIAIAVMERLYFMMDRIETVSLIPHLALAIARHRLADSYRHSLRTRPQSRLRLNLTELIDPEGEPGLQDLSSLTPSETLQVSEARNILNRAMVRLEPDAREILLLSYFEDLSTREIANVLNISESVVRVRRARALSMLRKAIDSSSELRSGLVELLAGPRK